MFFGTVKYIRDAIGTSKTQWEFATYVSLPVKFLKRWGFPFHLISNNDRYPSVYELITFSTAQFPWLSGLELKESDSPVDFDSIRVNRFIKLLDKVIAQTPVEAQQEALEFSEALSRAEETLKKDKSVGFDM